MYILAVLTFFSSNKVCVNQLALGLENDFTKPTNSLNYAVILGGYANWNTKTKSIQLSSAGERLFTGFYLINTKLVDTLLLSGGTFGNTIAEATIARNYLIKCGLSPFKIKTELNSLSTFQNATECAKIVPKTTKFYLVTSAWHMTRALATFKKQGLNCIPYSVNYISVPAKSFTWYDYIFPSSQALQNFELLIKEYVGIIAYKLSGKL